jgi:hypothetical protein
VPTGTGASIPLLRERVGPYGRVHGVDHSGHRPHRHL